MPQLDIVGYVSQLVWLIVMFFVLYLVVVGVGLPRIYKVLSFRKKKLTELREGVVLFEKELYFLEKNVKVWGLGLIKNLKMLSDQVVKDVNYHVELVSESQERARENERSLKVSNVEKDAWKTELFVSEKLEAVDKIVGKKDVLKKQIFKG